MVRVKYFGLVPDAGIRKDIRRLDREQMELEGKSPPSNASASTLSLTSREIARSHPAGRGSPEEKAEQIIENLLPREVTWYRGSLVSGRLDFQLPAGILHIVIPADGIFLEHHLHPPNGDGAVRSQAVAGVETDPVMQAVEVLELVGCYINSMYTVAKAKLAQRIKENLAPPHSTHLSDMLRRHPRDICNYANVARFGWHFLRAESILDLQLESRFITRIKEMRDELNKLPTSEFIDSVPEAARSKSRAQMTDYLLEPQYTFHGPKAENVGSIAQVGLLAAGDINPLTGERIPGRVGSTFGPGVYVTEEANLALTYAEWDRASLTSINAIERLPGVNRKRMIICATVLGRAALITLPDNYRNKDHLYPGAHSHVANGGQEYIVPPTQVLPLYAADFDWIPSCEEHKRNYVEYARGMVAPPRDDVETMGRWFQFGKGVRR